MSAIKPLPHTYLAKGKYWYFRRAGAGNIRIEGDAFSPHFMWHYRQLMAQSGATAKQAADRRRIRRLEAVAGKRAESLVYFIGIEPDGPIKIGSAKDVRQRLMTLQVAVPQPLAVLATVPGGVVKEREYHARFQVHRLRGEWFSRTPELAAEIAALGAPE